MGHTERTAALVELALKLLTEEHPETLRGLYYRLVCAKAFASWPARKSVSGGEPDGNAYYDAVGVMIADARLEGVIPWEWIEDRTRRPYRLSTWPDLAAFESVCLRSFRLKVWPSQPRYLEVWLEKDCLAGTFGDVLDAYGVTLNVGKGFDGWSSIHAAAQRFVATPKPGTILYWGDFDPSGWDMPRSLGERLGRFGCRPEIIRCALVATDMKKYNLPWERCKKSDTRTPAFIAVHRDFDIKLDSLPLKILREKLTFEVESRMDPSALAEVKRLEDMGRKELAWKFARTK